MTASEDSSMQNYTSQNQERYVPLSMILDNAIQKTYHQLTLMIELFPSLPDKERKIKIIAYACKTRLLFMRIYALVKFMRSAHINVSNILSFLDHQAFIFVDTADYLYHLAKVKLVNARLPSYSVLTAVDVLTLGTYPRLPSCINDRILLPEKISNEEKKQTLNDLSRIIQCRLALSELPVQLKQFKIGNGCVVFHVKNEFEIKLTLISDDFKLPWRVLKINFLVKDSQDPNRPLVHSMQINYTHDIVQMRLNENNRPLVDIYKSLHFFAQSLQLEVLFDQMNSLNRLTLARFYKITEYSNWKKLTVKYWLDNSKNQYEFKFSILTNENSDFLQTSHYPPLHWRDHRQIDSIFRTDELIIEKVIHHIIKYRSKKRLMEIQSAFENMSYCKTSLIENKPALEIQFNISKFKNQSLWIMIDYYSGLFQVIIPNAALNLTLKMSIEACINSDLKNIDQLLLSLRVWLLLKRSESLIQSYGFKCCQDLSIVSYSNTEQQTFFNKLEKNRLFIELKKQERMYILVTIKTKDQIKEETSELCDTLENENSILFNYFILNIAKCKYDGELDPTKPFLKLISMSQFKRSSLFNINQNIISKIADTRQIIQNGIDMDSCIIEFVKMIYLIEERLPYLSFIKILNKQNIVTQNVHSNPELLHMLCLSFISAPTVINSQEWPEFQTLASLSRELWNLVTSFTIRQKQFKDYLNMSMPLVSFNKVVPFGMLSKFIFVIELTYNHGILFDESTNFIEDNPTTNSNTNKNRIDVYNIPVEANSLEALYNLVKLEWIAICKIYGIIIELRRAWQKYPELALKIKIKKLNFKRIVLKYGPGFVYTIQFRWQRETRTYDISLGVEDNLNTSSVTCVNQPQVNYHFLFLSEIKRYFASTNFSVIELLQILNCTCVSTFGLAKLNTLPKFYTRVSNQPVIVMPGFMLLICSLTHLRFMYYSRYCLDIHVKSNGLVSIRDGSFGLTDISTGIEDLHPVQFLNTFLNLFLDESVQELLRRPCSLVEDDNPASPSSNAYQQSFTNQLHSSQAQQQHQQTSIPSSQSSIQSQQHVFVPPTSPVVQPRSVNPNIPTPSPSIPNYFVQSPGISAPPSNAPPSIAQSPGFANFGSPAMSHSSPSQQQQQQSQSQQQHSNSQQQQQSQQPPSVQPPLSSQQAQPLSASAQSPSGFMSPATNSQQPNYSTQSPANFTDISLQSPLPPNSVPVKSPYVGPSPGSNIQSNYGKSEPGGSEEVARPKQTTSASLSNPNSNQPAILANTTSALLLNQYQYKKCHSASIPIYLSENGFLKMLKKNADSNYCPLEIFLASFHLKKKLIKMIQSDQIAFLVKNADANVYKTHFLEFQINNEITQQAYHAFSLTFMQTSPDMPVDYIQRYFNTKIHQPPFKFAVIASFFNLISINEPKILKEFVQILDFELNPYVYKFPWRLKLSWSMPNGYQIKNPNKANFSQFYQNSVHGFQRPSRISDKYYFLVYLFNQQRVPGQHSPHSLLLLVGYDSSMNGFALEILRPLNEINHSIYNTYEAYLASVVSTTKQKDMSASLLTVLSDILSNLPCVANLGPNMPPQITR